MNLREQAALEYDEHSKHLNELASLEDDGRIPVPVQIQNTAVSHARKQEPSPALNSRGAGRERKRSAYTRTWSIEPWQARRAAYLRRSGRSEDLDKEGLGPIAGVGR